MASAIASTVNQTPVLLADTRGRSYISERWAYEMCVGSGGTLRSSCRCHIWRSNAPKLPGLLATAVVWLTGDVKPSTRRCCKLAQPSDLFPRHFHSFNGHSKGRIIRDIEPNHRCLLLVGALGNCTPASGRQAGMWPHKYLPRPPGPKLRCTKCQAKGRR